MGNQQQVKNNQISVDVGGIHVQIEKPYYIAGDQVNGHIYLNLQKQFAGNIMYLKVKGIENVFWQERHTRVKTRRTGSGKRARVHRTTEVYYVPHRGKNIFFSHKFILFQWQIEQIQSGQFGFPFQFLLQQNLPGSFIGLGVDYNVSIRYKIKGELPQIGSEMKIKNKQDVIIREPIKDQVGQQFKELRTHVKTWCCLNKGECYIKCYIDKNYYIPGETAIIVTEIDNTQCKLDILNIKCILKQNLVLKSNQGRIKLFHQNVREITLEGVKAGQSNTNDKKQTQVLLQGVSVPIQPSTHGQFVICDYVIVVVAKFNGCTCCNDDPQLEIPITLICPPLNNLGQIQKPQDWNPQMFDIKTIQFNKSDMYTSKKQMNDNQNMDMDQISQQQQLIYEQQSNNQTLQQSCYQQNPNYSQIYPQDQVRL